MMGQPFLSGETQRWCLQSTRWATTLGITTREAVSGPFNHSFRWGSICSTGKPVSEMREVPQTYHRVHLTHQRILVHRYKATLKGYIYLHRQLDQRHCKSVCLQGGTNKQKRCCKKMPAPPQEHRRPTVTTGLLAMP